MKPRAVLCLAFRTTLTMILSCLSRRLPPSGSIRLRRISTKIEIARQIDFPKYWPPHGVDKRLSERLDPVPYVPRPTTCPITFNVTENLYVGEERWSQVYRGVLNNGGAILDDVVLKVFDESNFDEKEVFETTGISKLPSGEASFRYTGEIMAWQESWAYEMLKSMQGTSIPHFHGVFQVHCRNASSSFTSPHFAVLMSYINGVPLVKECRKVRAESGEQAWFPLAREVYTTLFKINQLGVVDIDVRAQNMKYDPSTKSVVFFDFTTARPSRFTTGEEAQARGVTPGMLTDVDELSSLLLDLGSDAEKDYGEAFRRRKEFRQWALREYDGTPWVEWARHQLSVRC
ncbi:hypothetical protein BKA70DRAFT_1272701 [Coprinopsis sp. MPI-PUGE-AT-0042]|nr:hypothetical protein BKA70DRAFT_1272701 [Coprinopsis sp. MPI-PUGE-AT-0042]